MSSGCEKRLRPWEEVIGVYKGVEVGDFEITVVLSCNGAMVRFAFPVKGLEAEILKRELPSCKPGTKVTLLKTDNALPPLLVRTLGTKDGAIR